MILLKFGSRVLDIKDGISQDKIQEFEAAHNFVLPKDYKDFLKRTNGVSLMGATVYGIYDDLTYTGDFLPEEVSDSFVDWAKEVLIDWTLEDDDYDGNERGST